LEEIGWKKWRKNGRMEFRIQKGLERRKGRAKNGRREKK